MFQIKNNFLHNQHLVNILNIVHKKNFVWFKENEKPFILKHYLVREQGRDVSPYTLDILSEILKNIEAKIILESTIVCYSPYKDYCENIQRSEFLYNKKYKTLILFLDNEDGYFNIVGTEKIKSRQNMSILIDYFGPYILTNSKVSSKYILQIHYQ